MVGLICPTDFGKGLMYLPKIGGDQSPTSLYVPAALKFICVNLNPLSGICIRYRHKFFDRVGDETKYASSENKYFFNK